MRLAFAIAAAIALVTLVPRAARVGLAGDYVDPVSRVTAQDEALYANTSIHMAREGGWLTPMFMGRFAFYKPPLLYWLSGAAAWIGGITTLALRFPVMLIAALAAGLLFLWAAEMGGWPAGALALALLVSNHLWHVLSSMAMTDGLLTAFLIAALYALYCDPWLESKAGLWGFAAAGAASVLTKGVAGVLPLAVLGLYWVVAPRRHRPQLVRVILAGALAMALAAPWFVYQLAAHGKWFRTEQLSLEILGYGAGAPPQTSVENPLAFYGMRLALTDPMLVAAALVAVPGLIAALRRRTPDAVLLGCWLLVSAVGVLGWQYRNIAYLLPMVPALALTAAAYGPLVHRSAPKAVLVVAIALVAAKAATPNAPWGISFRKGTVQPLAAALQNYCSLARANTLVVVGLDDDLYAAALPISVRYALVGGSPVGAGPYAMDFRGMGIIVSGDQFKHLEQWTPVFRRRLHEWGLDSTLPLATLILVSSGDDLAEIVRAHPSVDFLIPGRYRAVIDAEHRAVPAAPDHWLLLGRSQGDTVPAWTCRM